MSPRAKKSFAENKDLTGHERALLSAIVRHIGISAAITATELADLMGPGYADWKERQFREVIHGLRRKGYPVCSLGGVGKWWPANNAEISRCTSEELRAKANDLYETARVMEESGVRMFGPQDELFATPVIAQ